MDDGARYCLAHGKWINLKKEEDRTEHADCKMQIEHTVMAHSKLASALQLEEQQKKTKKKPKESAEEERPDPYKTAMQILAGKKRDIITLKETGEVYLRQNRVYHYAGREMAELKAAITQTWPTRTNHERSEIISHIKDRTLASRLDFDSDPNLLNCKNEFVHLESGRKIDEDPDNPFLSTRQLDVNFVPDAGESTKFLKFLEEIMPDPDTRAAL